MVFFTVEDGRYSPRTLIAAAASRGVRIEALGRGRIRAVTLAGVGDAAIDRAIEVFGDLLGRARA